MTTAEDLFALLPRHLRTRDSGLLRALLEAIAQEASVLDEDVRGLYEDWFVETADDWALPYLADLLGIDDLPPGRGRRAVIANTLDYRRGKGTVAVAEQVARDVVGSPAKAVEHLPLLAATAHVNHIRLDRPATAPVRHVDERSSARVANGALDPLRHTGEVRRAPSGRGRYGIGSVWVYSFGASVHPVADVDATPGADAWWAHPLGVSTPLFAVPAVEDGIEHLAEEADLPLPLRPRRLLAMLRAVRDGLAGHRSLPITVVLVIAGTEEPLTAERLHVCALEDLPEDPTGWHAFVDPVAGHVRLYLDGAPVSPADPAAPDAVLLSHCLGGRPDVGAGTYDRTHTHELALAEDPYVPRLPGIRAQHHVVLNDGGSLAQALVDAATGWAGGAGRTPTAGGTTVVSVADSGRWPTPLSVEVPAETRLVLVAAGWQARHLADGSMAPPVPGVYSTDGQRPVLREDLSVTGRDGASLLLDGIVVIGDLVVTADGMTALTLSQCTVTGTVRVLAGGEGGSGAGATGLTVRLLRSMVGRVDLADTAPALEIVDSVVSPEVGAAEVSGPTVTAAGAHLDADGSTIRGDVFARTLAGTDVLFDGAVAVLHRQVGCLRHSYAGPGSQTPRRFAPVEDRPSYGSVAPGDPDFLVLTSPAVETASESGNEVGVDAHLRRPELLEAARRLVAAHLPVGVDLHVRASRRPR